MCNWEIEPSANTLDLDAVKDLSEWMNNPAESTIPNIYYIHCASGHDRTGIVASAYMVVNKSFDLDRSLIYGTTVAKLDGGTGQLQVDCIDLDGTNAGKIDPHRSRIQMIATNYADAVMNVYNIINGTSITQLPAKASKEDKSNVYSTYPWETSLTD